MQQIKVALCQMKVVDDLKINLNTAKKMIQEATNNNAKLIALPEMFICPYSNNKFKEYSENKDLKQVIPEIQKKAKENSIYIIAGSIPELVNDKLYNTAYVINDKGKIIGKHRKIHLFDIDIPGKITFKESDTLTGGNKITVIDTPIGKIGIGICYDIRFPELWGLMNKEKIDFAILPGAFNMITGPMHWQKLLQTRAIDNQIYMLAISPARNDNPYYIAYGHSMIINPQGEIVVDAKEDENIIYSILNPEKIKEVRQQIPLTDHKRNDIYKLEKI
ncbi:MAG: carbon-nitrogen hydrolase family protein [Methanobacteriaceae archaeon]|nr:carbon-nitrogen hydrolase family protein [Methanobacteriaceae archaeon]